MTELERRALLGDRQAQEKCTRQGIALSCPICHEPVKVSVSNMLYACAHCHITVSFNSLCVKPEDTLRIWNTRPAPPIGRCDKCINATPSQYFGQDCYWCDVNECNMEADDYCSYFEESKSHEQKEAAHD